MPDELSDSMSEENKCLGQVEKIALFIDGANLYATAKSLGFDIDYKRLLGIPVARQSAVRAFYYTAVIEDQEYSSIRPLIDWLDYNGYHGRDQADQGIRRRRPAAARSRATWTSSSRSMPWSSPPHVDHMVLFSGDGDFRSLVEAVQRRGVRVTVVSTISTQPPMVADELRRQADVFIDIVDLQPKIGRDPAERAGARARGAAGTARTRRNSCSADAARSEPPAGADDDFED